MGFYNSVAIMAPTMVAIIATSRATMAVTTHRLLSSSCLGLLYRILNTNHKKGTTNRRRSLWDV